MSKMYTKEALTFYAVNHAVRLIDFEGQEYKGWLISTGDTYTLFPLNDIWNTYKFKRSHIKEIYHLTNNKLVPKDFLG